MTRLVTVGLEKERSVASSILPPSKVRMGNRLRMPRSKEAQENMMESREVLQNGDARMEAVRLIKGPAEAKSHSSP